MSLYFPISSLPQFQFPFSPLPLSSPNLAPIRSFPFPSSSYLPSSSSTSIHRCRVGDTFRFSSMAGGFDSFSGLCSCRVFSGYGTGEFSSGSEEEEEDDECNGSDEEFVVGFEEPDEINGSSSRLPDRWDVLGLGQAMVILLFLILFLEEISVEPFWDFCIKIEMIAFPL